jgi:folate-binding protein YgfZ
MESLPLHQWHQAANARFGIVNETEVVSDYGDALQEYAFLRRTAGVLDLAYRSRLCLTGADRVRFLNGQVTNHIAALRAGQGCYAALVNSKGRMESDLHVHCLPDELLLDFEPGLTSAVRDRLGKYLVADEVEVVDLKPHYGLWSVQGPEAATVLAHLHWPVQLPELEYQSVTVRDDTLGERLIVAIGRLGGQGFDLFVPAAAAAAVGDQLVAAAGQVNGGLAGWEAMELLRIEEGIPRYGQDMDAGNIPLEAGLEARAVRYNKGCYIGQEVINRIHSIGHVTKTLHGLLLPDDLPQLPARGDKLLQEGKPVGYITSSRRSPAFQRNLALGYVRKEVIDGGHILSLVTASGHVPAQIVALPFSKASL